jgi:hypothetical protein
VIFSDDAGDGGEDGALPVVTLAFVKSIDNDQEMTPGPPRIDRLSGLDY